MAEFTDSEKKFLDIQNEKLADISKREERRINSLFLKDKDALKKAISSGMTYHFFNDGMQQQVFQLIARYLDTYDALLNRNTYIELVEKNFKQEERIAMFRTQYDALFSIDVQKDDFKHLFDGLEGRFLQRQAFDIVGRYYEPLVNLTTGQKKLVEEFQREVSLIQKPFGDNYNRVVDLATMLSKEVMPEILERKIDPKKFHGIPCGFKCIDSIYNGFRRGKYLVLCAMEGGGKTTVMFNFALNMLKAGYKVVYVTIEANAKEASYRMLTIHSAVNINKIYKGGEELNEYVMKELSQAKDELLTIGSNFHWVQCLQKTPWSRIEVLLNQKLAFTDIDVIFVDYLDEIGSEVSYPGRPDLELADVSGKVQSFGRTRDVLCCTAQQLKTGKVQELQKKSVAGDDFRIGTGDVSGTKRIAAACDYLFGAFLDQLTRERVHLYNAKARQNKSAERFSISIDLNSGRMEDLPDTFEFRKEVSNIADETIKKELVKDDSAFVNAEKTAPKSLLDDMFSDTYVKDDKVEENWLNSTQDPT